MPLSDEKLSRAQEMLAEMIAEVPAGHGRQVASLAAASRGTVRYGRSLYLPTGASRCC